MIVLKEELHEHNPNMCAVYIHALICDKVLQYVLETVVDSICKESQVRVNLTKQCANN